MTSSLLRTRSAWRGRTGRRSPLVAVAVLLLASCSQLPPPRPPEVAGAATPRAAEVESVLFLVGDPGEAIPGRSPLLRRVRTEIREWAGELNGGEVRVAWLGDLVYPVGIRPVGDPDHGRDTLALHAQLRTTRGTNGTADPAEGLFIPGNHDWGNTVGPEGRERLAIMEEKVAGWREAGHRVRFLPSGGRIGPSVVPLTDRVRAIILDTQAWLGADEAERSAAIEGLVPLFADPSQLSIVLTHHPLRTGGNHGERGLGDPLALLSRAGAIPQDLASPVYSRMKEEIEGAIEAAGRRPLLMASGHDHNLQLFRPEEGAAEAEWLLVAGSGSKLTDVVDAPGMLFGGPWPGFGRLFLLKDGGVVLQTAAAEPKAKVCWEVDDEALHRCMTEGATSFRTIWSERIH